MIHIDPIGFFGFLLIRLILINSSALGNEVNERCTTPESRSGTCIKLLDCTHILDLVKKKPLLKDDIDFLRKSQCGSRIGKVHVCCLQERSRNNVTTANWITDESYNELPKFPEPGTCGSLIENRIYAGNVTKIGEYPWMVLIEYNIGEYRSEHNCGGSLINDRYVLTAAHCIENLPETWKPTKVRLGEWNTKTNPDCEKYGNGQQFCADPYIDVQIEKAIVHEKYNFSSLSQHNDIGLLRLSRSIEFTEYIRPICLPFADHLKRASFDGVDMYISGWGKTEKAARSSLKQKATIAVFPLSDCQHVYRPPIYDLRSSHICAGGENGIDSCDGDSGGPLIGLDKSDNKPSYQFIAGIVSFGPNKCGSEGYPGIYTRVSSYIDWIVKNIEP